jgi:hypothetical protein
VAGAIPQNPINHAHASAPLLSQTLFIFPSLKSWTHPCFRHQLTPSGIRLRHAGFAAQRRGGIQPPNVEFAMQMAMASAALIAVS